MPAGDADGIQPHAAAEEQSPFTEREREIVSLLAHGLSGVEIAEALSLSPETVRTHIRNASGRVNARTRVHLVTAAIARGEVTLDPLPQSVVTAARKPVPDGRKVPDDRHDPATASPREVIDYVLEIARDMLGMDAAFVSDTRAGVQEYVAFVGESFGRGPGDSIPLEGTYCTRLLDGRLPNLIPDSSQEPLVSDLAVTADADLGAYVGVPLVLSDGNIYGTFCCLSHEPEPLLQERDTQFMRVLARLITDLIERADCEGDGSRERTGRPS